MDRVVRSVGLVNGINLPYVEQGDPDGMPVVLLHAWGESKESFDLLLHALPPSMRVLAMDQRGHGDADKPETGYSMWDYAADLEAFMDALARVRGLARVFERWLGRAARCGGIP